MKIYWFETVNPRKVCSVAKHLGSAVDYEWVDLRKGAHKQTDYLEINPNGKVPSLVDGDLTLWESAAICAYLAGRAGSPMWPSGDVRGQAEILKHVSWYGAQAVPAFGTFYFEHYVKSLFGFGPPDEAKLAAATAPFHAAARILDRMLAGRDHLACDRLTIADFVVGAILPDWKAQAMPLDDYPNVRRWVDGLLALDAFRDPWPRR